MKMKVYWVFVAYLTLVFGGVGCWYRRLILADVGITYAEYGVALIEAWHSCKSYHDRRWAAGALSRGGSKTVPLIFPTLLKTAVFTPLCQNHFVLTDKCR